MRRSHKLYNIDRIFLSIAGLAIISQFCLGMNDTNVRNIFCKKERISVNNITNPRECFVSEIAYLFNDWVKSEDGNIEQKINMVFKKLDIKARLINNTLELNGNSFEFLVYINKYNRSFLVRYTPLADDINKLIQKEEFKLEIKVFSAWRPLPLDRLFG